MGLVVKEVMARHSPSIALGTAITTVVETLLRHKITGLPVVDAESRVVGFVSEQDCLRSLLVSSYHCEGSPKVDDVMHREPLTVSPEASVVDMAEMMVKQKPKVYPVVDESQRLVGLLLRSQVLTVLKDNRNQCD
ncbi:CBS domain-containing protein [Alcanivorax quisquiliarum]|uniref:CBS domain-containing protein n=1 Tax=Alcanivorax quisquiliarum TaxID=2933565 RepID=A0ABT0E4J4_9GAMM|nr:CBS domain-containing protein [Alcanivorax quisquiliarum]MCK0536731.1 CBS domain-containing protein [Alcanivorax quisquiliarum]